MKQFIFFILLISSSTFIYGITDTTTKLTPKHLEETMPEYPGRNSELMKYIQANVVYPDYEKKNNISGMAYVTFVVEKDGSISEEKILRGIPNGAGCDAEALRVVKSMPKWRPGTQDHKPVRVQFNLPIKFTIKNSELEFTRNKIASEHYAKAIKYYHKNKYKKAIDEFTYVLDVFINEKDALFKRGEMYFKLGNTEKACKDWNKIK